MYCSPWCRSIPSHPISSHFIPFHPIYLYSILSPLPTYLSIAVDQRWTSPWTECISTWRTRSLSTLVGQLLPTVPRWVDDGVWQWCFMAGDHIIIINIIIIILILIIIEDLDATHFDRHHVYRIEWQPGRNGYLNWWVMMIDDPETMTWLSIPTITTILLLSRLQVPGWQLAVGDRGSFSEGEDGIDDSQCMYVCMHVYCLLH